MMMMKFPVANCRPCTYAVPRPSLPARARSWMRFEEYTFWSCFAISCVPANVSILLTFEVDQLRRLRTIWRSIVDDDYFPVEVVLSEGLLQKPNDDGEVAPLIVGWQED